MQLKKTRDVLNAFGKYVVKQSRSNLTKGRKNSTSEERLQANTTVEITKVRCGNKKGVTVPLVLKREENRL